MSRGDTTLGVPTPQCLQVMALLEDQEDGVLLSREAVDTLEVHLPGCAHCLAHQVFLKELAEDIQSLPDVDPPEGLADKIMAKIQALPAHKSAPLVARQWQWAAAAVLVVVSLTSLSQWTGKPSGPVVAQGPTKAPQTPVQPHGSKTPSVKTGAPVKPQAGNASGVPVAAPGVRIKIAQPANPDHTTPSYQHDSSETTLPGGELIADASVGGDDILFSLATSPASPEGASGGKGSTQDSWSVDQDQQMSASGEVSLVDFVGF